MGHGEHDMEIVHRDQFARTRRYPAVACQDLALGAVAVRQELKEKPRSLPHCEQRSRWRPSAAVRQRSMARMTLCCGQEMRARLRSRNRWAEARKISATSRAGRFMKPPAPVRSAQPDRTSAADWAPTLISAWTDAGRSWCRADRRGRAEPESPATRRHCRAYGWRSSASAYADALAW